MLKKLPMIWRCAFILILASDLEAVEKSADGYIHIDDYDGNEWRISDVESPEEDSNSEVIDLEVA